MRIIDMWRGPNCIRADIGDAMSKHLIGEHRVLAECGLQLACAQQLGSSSELGTENATNCHVKHLSRTTISESESIAELLAR